MQVGCKEKKVILVSASRHVPWRIPHGPRSTRGSCKAECWGDMRLKMPPDCPGLAQPVQSLSRAITLGALSIIFLCLPRLTFPLAATPNAGHGAKLSGKPAGCLSNFIKLIFFWGEHFHFSESAALECVCLSAAMKLKVGTQGKAPGTCT